MKLVYIEQENFRTRFRFRDLVLEKSINLAKMILENNGFLLSELIPQQELSMFSLIKRDRLQSALTSGIIIPESGIKGGTVNTFKYAKEQKKEDFLYLI